MGICALLGVLLICLILLDGFESMVQPRRVTRRLRFTRFFYHASWQLWRVGARLLPVGKRRESFLSIFGPLSLLLLLAAWVVGLIAGFALVSWSLAIPLQAPDHQTDFSTYLYLSGVTFFTLGYGEVTPVEPLGRFLSVVEAGIGFGFLAVIIGYIPVVYQAFSELEVSVLLLDARAGSPPTAGQLLFRLAQVGNADRIHPILAEWERWSAHLLGSHLSFPVLSYYRSQHANQSWLAAQTAILDTCALIVAGVEHLDPYQARLTFAMTRHAVVDLALVFDVPPLVPNHDRLPEAELQQLRETLATAGLSISEGPAFERKLAELRELYEPFVTALANHFLFSLPPFWLASSKPDNWQTSAWTRPAPGIGQMIVRRERHFD